MGNRHARRRRQERTAPNGDAIHPRPLGYGIRRLPSRPRSGEAACGATGREHRDFPLGNRSGAFHSGSAVAADSKPAGLGVQQGFISTRTWEPVYAIDVLVAAFALVRDEKPSARLLLLGNGSRQEEIRAQIADLALDDFIHAPGRVSQDALPDYFRSANAYVSSALSDGTSVSLLEAMASGLPVIVSDSYGNLEWVEPGTNGELARPGDPESLAEAMLAVVTSAGRANRMARANVEVARTRADWSRNFPLLARRVEALAAA